MGTEHKFQYAPIAGRTIRVFNILPNNPGDSSKLSIFMKDQTLRERKNLAQIAINYSTNLLHDGYASLFGYQHKDSEEGLPFTAISYVWGNPNSEKIPILCNGMNFEITKSLHGALQKLRNEPENGLIWADAICINQQDNAEKSEQVGMMGDIYALAKCVFIWLGEQEKYDEAGCRLMEEIYQHFRVVEGRNFRVGGDNINLENVARNNWNGLVSIINKPWFQRVWVLQEFLQARKRVFHCGSIKISERVLFGACKRIGANNELKEAIEKWSSVQIPGQGDFRLFGPLLECSDIMPGNTALYELFRNARTFQATQTADRLFALVGLSNTPSIKTNYERAFNEVFEEFIRSTMQQMLIYHEPDKVFLLLSMVDEKDLMASEKDLIASEKDLKTREKDLRAREESLMANKDSIVSKSNLVVKEKHLIAYEKCLIAHEEELLANKDSIVRIDDLPRSKKDWPESKKELTVRKKDLTTREKNLMADKDFKASKKDLITYEEDLIAYDKHLIAREKGRVHVRASWILRIKGGIFDLVRNIFFEKIHTEPPVKLTDNDPTSLTAQGAQMRRRLALYGRIWKHISSMKVYPTRESLKEVFWRSMIFNTENTHAKASPEMAECFQSHLVEMALGVIFTKRGIEYTKANLAGIYKEAAELLKTLELDQTMGDSLQCPKTLWSKLQGDVIQRQALGKRWEKACSVLTWGRQYFASYLGYVGWAPDHAQEGDLICTFNGCRFPFVVRPPAKPDQGISQQGRFRLIGACYMHGIMEGEASEVARKHNPYYEAYIYLI